MSLTIAISGDPSVSRNVIGFILIFFSIYKILLYVKYIYYYFTWERRSPTQVQYDASGNPKKSVLLNLNSIFPENSIFHYNKSRNALLNSNIRNKKRFEVIDLGKYYFLDKGELSFTPIFYFLILAGGFLII